jgi:hypothetical protein
MTARVRYCNSTPDERGVLALAVLARVSPPVLPSNE